MNFRCLLFDLDGTLVDSRADITNSVNLTLTDLGRATLSDETIRLFIGEGVRLLLERALRATQTNEPTDAEVDEALRRYRGIYGAHLLDQTRLYPEVAETLEYLRPWPKALVTNKPIGFTQPLLEGIGLAGVLLQCHQSIGVALAVAEPERIERSNLNVLFLHRTVVEK